MDKKHIILTGIGLILLSALIILLATSTLLPDQQTTEDKISEELYPAALDISKAISHEVEFSEKGILTAAERFSRYPADDVQVFSELMNQYALAPNSYGFIRVDENGVITSAAPATNPNLYAYDISGNYQENFKDSKTYLDYLKNKNTGATDFLLTAPVYYEGEYTGFVGLVADSRGFIAKPLAHLSNMTGFDVWVLDGDGVVISDADGTFIGANLSEQAAGSDSEEAGAIRRILDEKTGTLTYSAYDYGKLRSLTRATAWDTIPAWGRELKILTSMEVSGMWTIDVPTQSTNLSMEEFAVEAYMYIKDHGKEAAIAEFNNPASGFSTHEYRVTAYDMNGTALAHPFRPEYVGTDRSQQLDGYNVPVFQMLKARALQGGGYTLFLYPNPSYDMQNEMLLSYVLPIDDDWFIQIETFIEDGIPHEVDGQLKYDLTKFSRSILQFLKSTEITKAIETLNMDAGLVPKDSSIEYMILGTDGTAYAWTNNPDGVGTNVFGTTDIYGGSIGRDMVAYAKEGGGFVYQYVPEPSTGQSSLKLMYVEPVDENYCIIASSLIP